MLQDLHESAQHGGNIFDWMMNKWKLINSSDNRVLPNLSRYTCTTRVLVGPVGCMYAHMCDECAGRENRAANECLGDQPVNFNLGNTKFHNLLKYPNMPYCPLPTRVGIDLEHTLYHRNNRVN